MSTGGDTVRGAGGGGWTPPPTTALMCSVRGSPFLSVPSDPPLILRTKHALTYSKTPQGQCPQQSLECRVSSGVAMKYEMSQLPSHSRETRARGSKLPTDGAGVAARMVRGVGGLVCDSVFSLLASLQELLGYSYASFLLIFFQPFRQYPRPRKDQKHNPV